MRKLRFFISLKSSENFRWSCNERMFFPITIAKDADSDAYSTKSSLEDDEKSFYSSASLTSQRTLKSVKKQVKKTKKSSGLIIYELIFS